MPIHKYIRNYSPELIDKVSILVKNNQLRSYLLDKYPQAHNIYNDNELREYVTSLKNKHMKKSQPLQKVIYDNKIHVVNNALGLHNYISRVQGNKLKSINEIRISSIFKKTPEDFLKMIAVHELAHLKERQHNRAFYRLCQHMLENYHQLEFDTRLYLIQTETGDALYE
ncbi:MAG: DUF45 domain-containing protein [Gammaproteobacteria bacterium]|nr:DUF45 domain-containing protein [Gammaproteobacteria bacterium]